MTHCAAQEPITVVHASTAHRRIWEEGRRLARVSVTSTQAPRVMAIAAAEG